MGKLNNGTQRFVPLDVWGPSILHFLSKNGSGHQQDIQDQAEHPWIRSW